MPELSGIEAFGLGIGIHWLGGAIAHFTPLDSTFNHLRRSRSIKIFIDLPVKLRQFGRDESPLFCNEERKKLA
jgi:hypothetical protein